MTETMYKNREWGNAQDAQSPEVYYKEDGIQYVEYIKNEEPQYALAQRLQTKPQYVPKPGRPPKKGATGPKQPLNAYNLFCRDETPNAKEQFPHYTPKEMSSHLGAKWNALPDDQKQPYQNVAQALRVDFNKMYPQFAQGKKLANKLPQSYWERAHSNSSTYSSSSSSISPPPIASHSLPIPEIDQFLFGPSGCQPVKFVNPTQKKVEEMLSRITATIEEQKRLRMSENHETTQPVRRMVKKPLSPFVLYTYDREKTLTEEQKTASLESITILMKKEWEAMDPHLKQEYLDAAQILSDEHNLKYPKRIRKPKGTNRYTPIGLSSSSREKSSPSTQSSLSGNSPVSSEIDDLDEIFPTLVVPLDYPWKAVIESLGLNPSELIAGF